MRATLEDNTSGSLATIRQNMRNVGKDADTSKSRREFSLLTDQIKGTANQMTGGLVDAFGKFRFSAAGVALGAAGVAVAIGTISKQLRDFANKNADAKFIARDLGLTVQQLEAFKRAAGEFRIDPGAATASLQTFAKNMEDFKLRIGGLREELYNLGAGDVVEAIGRAKTTTDGLRIAFERMQELQAKNPAVARRFAESMFGNADAARMTWQEFQKANREVAQMGVHTQKQIEASEAFRKQWEKLSNTLADVRDGAMFGLFPAFTKGLEGVNVLVDKTIAGFEKLKGMLPGGGASQNPRSGFKPESSNESWGDWFGKLFSPGAARLGGRKTSADDTNDQLRSLADNLKKVNFEMTRGGGGGAGGVINASFGGSAGAARGGGFGGGGYRNLGSAPSAMGGAGNGAGGGSNVVPFTGGGGGTRGDRNNNPGNLKFGPLAQQFGATGADDRGFAVFPNRMSGEAAQEALVSSDRYKGLTLRQFAGKYAEGSADWQKTVGGALGIGPNDVVDNRDPRLVGAIRRAEGTGRLGPASVGGIDPHRMDPMAPAGSGIDRDATAEVRTSRGRTFKVAPWARENFQRFIDNYEKAGGDLGPDTGTLGTRPGNRSYHPLGRAIDVNQVGYGVRSRRGGTLPREVEDRIAEDAGLWPGSRFGDAGHFEARNRALVEAKQAQWARERMDAQAKGSTMKAEGTVNVRVDAPNGTKVTADSDGMFQKTSIQRYRQMGETGLDGGAQ